MAQCKARLLAFVFSSSTGQWRANSSTRWKDLFPVPRLLPSKDPLFLYRQYSYGCFYWSWRTKYGHYGTTMNDMLVLDTERMEFSIAEPPTHAKNSADGFGIAMVEAGESMPGLFTYTAGVLGYSVRQNDSESLSQCWKKDSRTISLGPGYSLVGSTGRYLFLYKFRSSLQASGFYTLDIKTFQLEKVCHTMKYSFCKIRAYINFPPSFLSLPTISNGSRSSAGKAAPPRLPPLVDLDVVTGLSSSGGCALPMMEGEMQMSMRRMMTRERQASPLLASTTTTNPLLASSTPQPVSFAEEMRGAAAAQAPRTFILTESFYIKSKRMAKRGGAAFVQAIKRGWRS